jgi:hypothetical protein
MKITKYFLVNDIYTNPEENLDDRHASIPSKYPRKLINKLLKQELQDGAKIKETMECINSGVYTIGIATYNLKDSIHYPDCWFEMH